MKKKIIEETVSADVLLYDNNQIYLDGRTYDISCENIEKSEDIVSDLCKKLKTIDIDFVNVKFGSLLAAHRLLFQ